MAPRIAENSAANVISMENATVWTCPGCGKESLDSAFCPDCGTKRPKVQIHTAQSCEGTGFSTPQEAASAYIEAINAGNVQNAVSTFAVETFVDNIDPEAYIMRLGAIELSSMYQDIPVAGPLSRSMLIEARRAEISNKIRYAYVFYSCIDTEFSDLVKMDMRPVQEENDMKAYLDLMRNSAVENWVGNITIKDVYLPSDPIARAHIPEPYWNEKNQQNIEKIRRCSNTDELQQVILLLDICGEEYIQLIECCRYGDVWYNSSLQSNIANLYGASIFCGGLVKAEELHW